MCVTSFSVGKSASKLVLVNIIRSEKGRSERYHYLFETMCLCLCIHYVYTLEKEREREKEIDQ